MIVLLPPSEAKAAGGSGPPVGARPALSTPSLAAPRAALLSALRRAARTDRAALVTGLTLPAGLADAALAADIAATRAPTLPALDRYTGVLYAALQPARLPRAARARAERDLVVLSGLWGVVRGGDLVPDYRVPAAGSVPGLGRVAAHWREPLRAVLPALLADEPVVDLRSTDYRALWRPDRALAGQVVEVRVLADRGRGDPAPVSHHAKSVKGLLARALVVSRRRQTDAADAVTAAAAELRLRVVDTSTRTRRSVDLVGPLTTAVGRTLAG